MARPYLPVRRGAGIVIFEHREVPAHRRWEFHAVAISPAPGAPMQRTGVAAIDDVALQECADLAERLPRLEAVLSDISLTDATAASRILDAGSETALVEKSMLLTGTLYLEFLRQSLVHETAVRRYDATDPAARFSLGMSASVVEGCLKRHEVARAEKLVDADLPHLPANTTGREWGHYFRLAATAKERAGKADEIEPLLLRAVRARPDQGSWRRIGLLREGRGDMAGAVDAFLAAERVKPLEGQPALRLGWWLQKLGRLDEAQTWARTAAERGAEDADKLLGLIEK